MDINKRVFYWLQLSRSLTREAVKVGSCDWGQRRLLADQLVHDGQLSVPLLHLLQRSPGHVVLEFKGTNIRVRAARTPFLQEKKPIENNVIKINKDNYQQLKITLQNY